MKLFLFMLVFLFSFAAHADLYTGPWTLGTDSKLTTSFDVSVVNLDVTGKIHSGNFDGTGNLALYTAANGHSYFIQNGSYMEFDLGATTATNVLEQFGCSHANCVHTHPDTAADTYVMQNVTQRLTNKQVAYSPLDPTKWASPAPQNLHEAMDRLAAWAYAQGGNVPIP